LKPVLGITMGDAAGIGPELITKAFADKKLFEKCRPVIIGDLEVMHFYEKLLNLSIPYNPVTDISAAQFRHGTLDILDMKLVSTSKLQIGVVDEICGNAAVLYTREAGRLALKSDIDAIVSAPLNKESMKKARYQLEGQTQILAELTNSKRYGMILVLGHIRTMMLTTHCSLRTACDAVTRERIFNMLELADETLKMFGIKTPKIAVAGLNPHCGDGGLFGDEEVKGSIPAIKDARNKGINAIGPVPADIVFVKAKDGEYDLVLAMYHDQANMAAKLLGFGEVVTILAGLPIIRTSVGHGTAFDIAGKGIADENNFVKAIEAAIDLAKMKGQQHEFNN
jgi:4-phospho-D-threonate 3-dehydrogenase / 4-phospho-D-erythronate 3-dehydrogenase